MGGSLARRGQDESDGRQAVAQARQVNVRIEEGRAVSTVQSNARLGPDLHVAVAAALEVIVTLAPPEAPAPEQRT